MRILFGKFVVPVLAVLATSQSVARADEPVSMIRIVCIPQISLFELETFGLDNIKKMPKAEEISANVYRLEDFVASAPFSCQINAGQLEVSIVNYHSPAPRGECGGMEWADLSIKLNGNEIDRIENTNGGCAGNNFKFYGHQVRATQYHLTHCRSDFDDFELTNLGAGSAAVETDCKKIPFPVA